MLPSQLWLLLDTAVLPDLVLEHTGTAVSLCFWLISPLSLGPSGTCSRCGSSVSVCTSSPKGCCVSSHWKRNRSVLLGLHPPLPRTFGWGQVASWTVSESGCGLHKPFYLLGLGDKKTMWEVLCCCMMQESCSHPDSFFGQSLRQGVEKQPLP